MKQFDTTTDHGRSNERYRRAALTTASSLVAKGASLVTFLVSVPLTIRYLGAERYGIWMTVSSLVTMLSWADFGIGNGVLTLLSESNGKADSEAAQRYVSSAFFMLAAVATLISVAAAVAYPFIPWQRSFNVISPEAVKECGPTMLVLIGCFAANMALGVTQRVQSGYQEGYISNLWTAAGSLLGLGAVVGAIYLRSGLPWLVLAISGGPVVAASLNTVWLFFKDKPWLRPSLRKVQWQSAKRLSHMGILFFVLQLALAIGFQSDNLVLAHVLGASKVAQYAVATRMFGFVPMLLTFIVMPLWPAYGEAFARGDVAWIRRTLTRSMAVVLGIAIPANLFLIFAGKTILKLWVGPAIVPGLALLVGIGISQLLLALASPISVFLNAINVLGFQAICFSLMALTNIVASVYLTRRIGVPGVVYGSIIAQCLFWIIPIGLFLPSLLRSLESRGKRQVEDMPCPQHVLVEN